MIRRFMLAAVAALSGLAVMAGPADAKILTHTPAEIHTVAVIGDSLSSGWIAGIATELGKLGVVAYYIDVRGGRSIGTIRTPFDSGLTALARMHRAGIHPDAYVIALGGNDLSAVRKGRLDATTEIVRMLDAIGPAPVAWLTIWGKFKARQEGATIFNTALHALAETRMNLHVVEWAPLLAANPKWFQVDGTHLRGGGIKARNVMLAQAAADMLALVVRADGAT